MLASFEHCIIETLESSNFVCTHFHASVCYKQASQSATQVDPGQLDTSDSLPVGCDGIPTQYLSSSSALLSMDKSVSASTYMYKAHQMSVLPCCYYKHNAKKYSYQNGVKQETLDNLCKDVIYMCTMGGG